MDNENKGTRWLGLICEFYEGVVFGTLFFVLFYWDDWLV